MSDLPDVASMKLSELKKELGLYCIDTSNFCEKQEFTSSLKNARETLPRPSTTYREVRPTEEETRAAEKAKRKASKKSSGSSTQNRRPAGGAPAPAPVAPAAVPAPAHAQVSRDKTNTKKLLALRSPVTARQMLRELPSERVLGERNNSFLPGASFSFALRGSLREEDSAVIRIPEGVFLQINAASLERKPMEVFLAQKGSIGVSLKISTEENPQMLSLWMFDKEKSNNYSVSDLGIRVSGPRQIRLLAFMEMGMRSGVSVDMCVFGSVGLDRDRF